MSEMTPREIVAELDRHIIGQADAKRAVAIALRNRWRRQQLDEQMRAEITPKNILMIGPTGVGKTEIARRLTRLIGAPFIKVEATKFTEVGYVGRDVESIIRDLTDSAFKLLREKRIAEAMPRATQHADRRLLDVLLKEEEPTQDAERLAARRRELESALRAGELDDREIQIDIASKPLSVDVSGPPGMEEMTQKIQEVLGNMTGGGQAGKPHRMRVGDARKRMYEEEASKLVDMEQLKNEALALTEESGIVFLDEIDKITRRSELAGPDVSREGVQRDLLPLIEGCSVKTRQGMVRTDHILFIASGAFSLSKPSDLIPELQGRLPIRVELSALSPEDFERILTEPHASLTEQYEALMQTEGLELKFTATAIGRIANIAWQLNENTENIGARRLHTVMERLLEEISYSAADLAVKDKNYTIDADEVDKRLTDIADNEDLRRYIL